MNPEKTPIAKYRIDACFKITGRGLVFAGELLEGNFSFNDVIEFSAFGKVRTRKIKAVEMIRFTKPNPNMIGVLIQHEDDTELEELRRWKPEGDEGMAFIFNKL